MRVCDQEGIAYVTKESEGNINATQTAFATCVYIYTIVTNLHRTKLANLSFSSL